jgi:hypothetical protein
MDYYYCALSSILPQALGHSQNYVPISNSLHLINARKRQKEEKEKTNSKKPPPRQTPYI